MQRLYSTFPNAWPGAGLLFLRVAQGVPILLDTDVGAWSFTYIAPNLRRVIELLTSGLLAAGLWTPIAGVLQAILECSVIYVGGHFSREHLLGALLGLCLAMLGPGRWSIDAHLYGRHRIQIKEFEE